MSLIAIIFGQALFVPCGDRDESHERRESDRYNLQKRGNWEQKEVVGEHAMGGCTNVARRAGHHGWQLYDSRNHL